MKIELALENWVDLFFFLSRSQLAELVSRIGDSHFVSFLEYFLNRCGKITLGKLHIRLSTNGTGPVIDKNGRELPLADLPMPENIKDFKEIHLSYFDESVLYFLQEFQRNSLLTNLNLDLYNHVETNSVFITNILPLISTIYSISMFDILGKEYYDDTYKTMMASTRVLFTDYGVGDVMYNSFCDWLFTPKEDGKPRILILFADIDSKHPENNHSVLPFIEFVKKYFLQSKQAASFSILFYGFMDNYDLQSLVLDNTKTNQKLKIVGGEDAPGGDVNISCYPTDAKKEWIIKEIEGYPETPYRRLRYH